MRGSWYLPGPTCYILSLARLLDRWSIKNHQNPFCKAQSIWWMPWNISLVLPRTGSFNFVQLSTSASHRPADPLNERSNMFKIAQEKGIFGNLKTIYIYNRLCLGKNSLRVNRVKWSFSRWFFRTQDETFWDLRFDQNEVAGGHRRCDGQLPKRNCSGTLSPAQSGSRVTSHHQVSENKMELHNLEMWWTWL